MDTKVKVPTAFAQECVATVRLLARSGKASFTRYLYDPLQNAGWSVTGGGQGARKLMDRIEIESKDPSYLQTIAPRCKRAIMYAMDENLSVLGESAIFFFNKMQLHTRIASSPESIQFTDILSEPFESFRKSTSEKSESLFRKAISEIEDRTLQTALEPVKLGSVNDRVRLDEEIKRLYDNILIASRYNNIPKCRKLLSNYIIRYSDDDEYAKDSVDRLVDALNKRHPGFGSELKEAIAIELNYRITQGVLNSDVAAAIRGIRKYGYIFEGDSDAKFFFEIDRLERILYQMITEKNMWDNLK